MEARPPMCHESATITPDEESPDHAKLRALGWFSVGMAVAALGIYGARELRSRYKFNHRTPYDFYTKSAEPRSAEFGVGI